MSLCWGAVQEIRDGGSGRWARVSVRGALHEVALDLVPEAQVGDTVLVHAGVALSRLRDPAPTEEDASCV